MNQLRKHLKKNIFHYLRLYYYKYKLGNLGRNVFIDNNVKFIRFKKNISVDDDVVIKEGARICSCNEKSKIKIGKRTTIGYHTFIFASDGITIGKDCLIAPFVYIVDSNHKALKGININQQGNETEEIVIGNDVWIASNVTILKGVHIANGTIIAAHSVVNKDTEANGIYGGVPAKKIGERNE